MNNQLERQSGINTILSSGIKGLLSSQARRRPGRSLARHRSAAHSSTAFRVASRSPFSSLSLRSATFLSKQNSLAMTLTSSALIFTAASSFSLQTRNVRKRSRTRAARRFVRLSVAHSRRSQARSLSRSVCVCVRLPTFAFELRGWLSRPGRAPRWHCAPCSHQVRAPRPAGRVKACARVRKHAGDFAGKGNVGVHIGGEGGGRGESVFPRSRAEPSIFRPKPTYVVRHPFQGLGRLLRLLVGVIPPRFFSFRHGDTKPKN